MNTKGIAEFLDIAFKLKETKRTGWVNHGVKNPESVADHSLLMALMCLLIPKDGIDKERASKMAVVHDISESVIGDLIKKEESPSFGTITNDEKEKLEEESLKEMISTLDKDTANEIYSLWKEYSQRKIEVAKFVRELNTAEMVIQSKLYHRSGNFKTPLNEFWDEYEMSKITDESIKSMVDEFMAMGR